MLIGKLEVLKSNAGYYIGRNYRDEDCGGMMLPYDRQTGYTNNKSEAEEWLKDLKNQERVLIKKIKFNGFSYI